MKKIGRFSAKFLGSFLAFVFIGSILFLLVPFVSFGKDLNAVAADAAALYGFDHDQYVITFDNEVKNSKGENISGVYQGYATVESKKVHYIRVQKHLFRPITIATIFHEFAHAAQYQYELDMGTLSREQHAEILSFTTMWQGGYKWNAIHLLNIHLVGKPKEYRIPELIWNTAFGNPSAKIQSQLKIAQ